MRCRWYIFTVMIWALFSACEESGGYQKHTSAIDSLYEDVTLAGDRLQLNDSAELGILMEQYRTYRRFIEMNFRDTLSRPQAETLRQFEEGGGKMAVFHRNREALLKRAALHKEQLQKLGVEAAKGTMDEEGLDAILQKEKEQAIAFTELVHSELEDLAEATRQFSGSLSQVQQLIREKNGGLLPAVVKTGSHN